MQGKEANNSFKVDYTEGVGWTMTAISDLTQRIMYPIKGYTKLYVIGFLNQEYYIYHLVHKRFLTIDERGYVQLYNKGVKRYYKVPQLYLECLPPVRFNK